MSRRVALGTVALVLAGTACSGAFGMPQGASEQGRDILGLWRAFFLVAIPVAGIVYVLIFWSIVRYRRRRADGDGELGKQFTENVPLEVAYTAIPLVIVAVLFVLALRTEDRVTSLDPNPDVVVEVEAFAWGWRFKYPEAGIEVLSEPSSAEATPPLLRLPLGQVVRFRLTSNDTIHSFWVPEFLYKHDAIPGRMFEFDVTPTRTGEFVGHCAEFCGLNHAYMNFSVHVMPAEEFEAWLAANRGEAVSP